MVEDGHSYNNTLILYTCVLYIYDTVVYKFCYYISTSDFNSYYFKTLMQVCLYPIRH